MRTDLTATRIERALAQLAAGRSLIDRDVDHRAVDPRVRGLTLRLRRLQIAVLMYAADEMDPAERLFVHSMLEQIEAREGPVGVATVVMRLGDDDDARLQSIVMEFESSVPRGDCQGRVNH